MRIITKELLEKAAEKLKNNPEFIHVSRVMEGTITFKDDNGCAFISFYHGKIVEVEDGKCLYGSDYYIRAANENWIKAFTRTDERYGIYELDGNLIEFDGNQYAFAGNAKTFYMLWLALRAAYLEGGRIND